MSLFFEAWGSAQRSAAPESLPVGETGGKTQGGAADGWRSPSSPKVNLNLATEWDLSFIPGLTVDGLFYDAENVAGSHYWASGGNDLDTGAARTVRLSLAADF